MSRPLTLKPAKALIQGPGRFDPTRGPKWNALAPMHRLFVDSYLLSGNATQAARDAGYVDSPASREGDGRGPGAYVRQRGSDLLKRNDVRDAIIECSRSILTGDIPQRLQKMVELASGQLLAEDPATGGAVKIRDVSDAVVFKANQWLLQQGGLRDVVQHEPSPEMKSVAETLKDIAARAKALGVALPLPASIDVTDADYEEIEDVPQTPAEAMALLEKFR